MKKLVFITSTLLVLVMLVASGCTEQESTITPEGEEELLSTCTTCHTDKDTLKELAIEEEDVKSEETTGEG